MDGWIKLHRKLLDSTIFNSEKGLKIWIWCLIRANHKDTVILLGRTRIALKKGQFVMGSHKDSEMLKIARATFWWWLEFLAAEGMVELKKTNKYTVVTIPNWKNYQGDLDSNKTQISKQTEPDKNVKNVKKNTLAVAKAPEGEPTPEKTLSEKQVAELIYLFIPINPACKAMYGRKDQRQACASLIEQYSYERVCKVINTTLPITNKVGYFPTITTPLQLWQKWATLEAAIIKENNKKHAANEKNGHVIW